MSKLEKYYSNHSRAFNFPWSIYHNPLLKDLIDAINSISLPENKEVLVIGPGDFFEFQYLKNLGFNVSVLDIDPRVIESTKTKFGNDILSYYLVDENFNGYPEKTFDFIYAKEVIEHIPETDKFLKKLHELGNSQSFYWFSTPNYGDWILPFIEKTFLEIIARFSGFTRKGIHPRPFSSGDLKESFEKNGYRSEKVLITPLKLALTIWARKA